MESYPDLLFKVGHITELNGPPQEPGNTAGEVGSKYIGHSGSAIYLLNELRRSMTRWSRHDVRARNLIEHRREELPLNALGTPDGFER